MSESLGLLILRLVVGLVIAAHGSQKLFGWFGGPGLSGMKGWLGGGSRLRPAWFWSIMAGLSEFGGGVLLAAGFLSPLGSLGVIAAMLMAIILAHWPRFWASNGGLEFPLIMLTSALVVGITGPGRYSLDVAFGIAFPAPASLVVGLVLVLLGIGVALLSRQPQANAEPAGQAVHPAQS